jgi:hypothetical protein
MKTQCEKPEHTFTEVAIGFNDLFCKQTKQIRYQFQFSFFKNGEILLNNKERNLMYTLRKREDWWAKTSDNRS